MPVSTRKWGLAGSESVMMMVPSLGPGIAGLNVTSIVQFAPNGKLPLQVSVSVKSMPEALMSRMRMAELLVLVRMAVLG